MVDNHYMINYGILDLDSSCSIQKTYLKPPETSWRQVILEVTEPLYSKLKFNEFGHFPTIPHK